MPPNLQRKDWQPYVDALAVRMRLGHWNLRILDEPPFDEGDMASVQPWDAQHAAWIRLSDRFLADDDPANQRHTIVHELVHCHFAHADQVMQHDLSPATGKAWALANEYGVDSIAQVIAPSMPLPDEILSQVKSASAAELNACR